MPSVIWTTVKLILTLVVFGGLAFVVILVLQAVQAGVESTKAQLAGKGVNITKDGVAVKTDRRQMTLEETQDKLQSGLMKGWKSASFNVPWILQKGTNLGGSGHDKGKAEWEKKHGPKKNKDHVA